MFNRRSFIGALAGILGFVKSGFSRSPPESAGSPTREYSVEEVFLSEPRGMVEAIEFQYPDEFGPDPKEWLRDHRPNRELIRFAGQDVFPVVGCDGGLMSCRIAYILPLGWKDRQRELQAELDGRALGRGNSAVRVTRS